MANINFPSSPTQSQVYTFGSSSWTFNGTAWVSTNGALGSSGTSQLVYYGYLRIS